MGCYSVEVSTNARPSCQNPTHGTGRGPKVLPMKWYQMRWAQKYWGKESRQRSQTYLQSDAWKANRKEVLKAGYCCCRCGARATEVHHETYKRIYNERLSDLTALYENCHKAAHTPTPSNRKQSGRKTMVDFRITWTLQIGEVRKPRLLGFEKSGLSPGRCGF